MRWIQTMVTVLGSSEVALDSRICPAHHQEWPPQEKHCHFGSWTIWWQLIKWIPMMASSWSPGMTWTGWGGAATHRSCSRQRELWTLITLEPVRLEGFCLQFWNASEVQVLTIVFDEYMLKMICRLFDEFSIQWVEQQYVGSMSCRFDELPPHLGWFTVWSLIWISMS